MPTTYQISATDHRTATDRILSASNAIEDAHEAVANFAQGFADHTARHDPTAEVRIVSSGTSTQVLVNDAPAATFHISHEDHTT